MRILSKRQINKLKEGPFMCVCVCARERVLGKSLCHFYLSIYLLYTLDVFKDAKNDLFTFFVTLNWIGFSSTAGIQFLSHPTLC